MKNHRANWEEHRAAGERIIERADMELERYKRVGQLSLDDMLTETVESQDWPQVCDVAGRDISENISQRRT